MHCSNDGPSAEFQSWEGILRLQPRQRKPHIDMIQAYTYEICDVVSSQNVVETLSLANLHDLNVDMGQNLTEVRCVAVCLRPSDLKSGPNMHLDFCVVAPSLTGLYEFYVNLIICPESSTNLTTCVWTLAGPWPWMIDGQRAFLCCILLDTLTNSHAAWWDWSPDMCCAHQSRNHAVVNSDLLTKQTLPQTGRNRYHIPAEFFWKCCD